MTNPYAPKVGRHLCKVERYPGAADILYNLLVEREPGQSISHQQMPTREEHQAFFNKPGYRAWYMICDGATPVGAVYLTVKNELGIAIFAAYRQQGYATFAVNEMKRIWTKALNNMKGHVPRAFFANINPNNAASIAFWKKQGFRHVQNTYRFDP